jgi:hypothetical protein
LHGDRGISGATAFAQHLEPGGDSSGMSGRDHMALGLRQRGRLATGAVFGLAVLGDRRVRQGDQAGEQKNRYAPAHGVRLDAVSSHPARLPRISGATKRLPPVTRSCAAMGAYRAGSGLN